MERFTTKKEAFERAKQRREAGETVKVFKHRGWFNDRTGFQAVWFEVVAV